MLKNINEDVKKFIKFLFISLLIAIVLELTIFNINFYRSLGNKQELINNYTISNAQKESDNLYKIKGERVSLNLHEEDDETYKKSVKATKDENGNYIFDENIGELTGIKNIYDIDIELFKNIVELEITDINKKTNNIYVDIAKLDTIEKNINVRIFYKDKGNSEYVYAGERTIHSDIDETKCFNLNFLGDTKDIRLEFEIDEDEEIELNNVILNKKRSINFNSGRVLLIIFLLSIFSFFRFKSKIYEIKFKDFKYKKIITIGIVVAYISTLIIVGNIFEKSNLYRHPANELYNKLTYSLLNGKVDIHVETNKNLEKISELDNPYDYSVRNKMLKDYELSFAGDSAYYNGKSYCYFGIIPVIICNIPYYVFTGTNISIEAEILLFSALYIISLAILFYNLIKKYYDNISFALYIVLFNLLLISSGAIILVTATIIHSIPNISALFFMSLGLNCWFSILKNKKYNYTKIAMGSFMMALVAGCRPNLIFSSLLLIPIIMKKYSENNGKEIKKTTIIKGLLAIGIPYTIVAIPLMYYNYIRFNSVFEFGANYNLTNNDILHRGIKLDRIPYGIYMYLFSVPTFINKYPYVKSTKFDTNYLGFTHYQEMFGGIFTVYIITLINFFYIRLKRYIKSKEVKVAYWICWIIAIILILINIEMAGINIRYMTDFIIFIIFATVLLILEVNKNIDDYKRDYFIKTVVIGIGLSILLEVISFFGFVFDHFDNSIFVEKIKRIFEFYI